MKKKTIDLTDAITLSLGLHTWGNQKSADKDKVETKADKEMLNITKRLLDPKGEIKEIERFLVSEVRSWVKKSSLAQFLRGGIYIFGIKEVEMVEERLQEKRKQLKSKVDAFLAVYPKKIKEMEKKLGDQFDQADYPSVAELRNMYDFDWQWVDIQVPNKLPPNIFAEQEKIAKERWEAAAEEITVSLRSAFKKLIDHAVSVLEVGEDGKTKSFKNSTFENITQFIDSFKNRNITNDVELEFLLSKAKKVMTGVDDPQDLKKDEEMRKSVEKGFSELTKKLDKLVEIKPKRKFRLDD